MDVNKNTGVTKQYEKLSKCVKRNDLYEIELLMLGILETI